MGATAERLGCAGALAGGEQTFRAELTESSPTDAHTVWIDALDGDLRLRRLVREARVRQLRTRHDDRPPCLGEGGATKRFAAFLSRVGFSGESSPRPGALRALRLSRTPIRVPADAGRGMLGDTGT
jgi:hypothetical protein